MTTVVVQWDTTSELRTNVWLWAWKERHNSKHTINLGYKICRISEIIQSTISTCYHSKITIIPSTKRKCKISVEYNPIEFQRNVKCTIVYIHNVPSKKVEPFSTSTSPKNERAVLILQNSHIATGSNKANDSIMKNDMNIRYKAKNVITDETKHSSELAWIYNYINASITNGAAILELYGTLKFRIEALESHVSLKYDVIRERFANYAWRSDDFCSKRKDISIFSYQSIFLWSWPTWKNGIQSLLFSYDTSGNIQDVEKLCSGKSHFLSL